MAQIVSNQWQGTPDDTRIVSEKEAGYGGLNVQSILCFVSVIKLTAKMTKMVYDVTLSSPSARTKDSSYVLVRPRARAETYQNIVVLRIGDLLNVMPLWLEL